MTESTLPPRWARARLDEVAEVRLGRQRSPKNHTGTQMRRYLRAANLTWHGIDITDVKEMNFTDDEVAVYGLRRGDVLLSEASGSASEVGKPGVWRGQLAGDICFQNTLLRVRPADGVGSDYLYYRLLHEASSGGFAESARGVGIHHLGAAKLAALPIGVPPTAEQRRIVAALDEHIERFGHAEAALLLLRRRIESLQHALLDQFVVGHPERVQLADAVNRVEAGKSFRCLARPAAPHEWGVIKVSAMTWGEFRANENKALPPGRAPEGRYEVKSGDLLVSRANTESYVGAPVLVEAVRPRLLLSDKSLRLVPADGVYTAWLANVLRAPSTRAQISALATGTKENMRNISQSNLLSVRIPRPPEPEVQRATAESADAARARLRELDAQLLSLRLQVGAFRRATLARAFAGDLVPRHRGDEAAELLLKRIAEDRAAAKQARGGGKPRTGANAWRARRTRTDETA